MSYCRWSCDDYQCDIYAFEADAGFMVHVATRRYQFKEPLPPPAPHSEGFDAYFARHKKVMVMVGRATTVAIDLPHDGEDFLFDTPGECADELERLRKCGYRVPQYAIDTLREEQQSP